MKFFPKFYSQAYVDLLREQYESRIAQLGAMIELLKMQKRDDELKEKENPWAGLTFDPANKDGAFGHSSLFEEKEDIENFINGRPADRDKGQVQA